MRYTNQNYKKEFSKVASVYDSMMVSNRPQERELSVSTLSLEENKNLNDFINKEASQLDGEIFKTASEGINKEAFFAGGLDLFTKTRQFIANKLGVAEDVAHDLTSPVLNQTETIVNRFGGDESAIVEGIVQEMGTQLLSEHHNLGGQINVVSMKPTGTKQLLEHIGKRLMQEMMMGSFEVERYKLAIHKEARNLATTLRPHTKYDIADAIIDLMIAKRDPKVVYNLKDSTFLVEDIRSLLTNK